MKHMTMTAITLVQPWGELVVSGKKTIECRNWKTNRRGFVALHASKKKERSRFELCRDHFKINVDADEVDYGAVIGFAEIVDVVDEEFLSKKNLKWFEEGQYAFVLENIIRLDEPVEVKGMMGFWNLQGEALAQCLNQLPKKQKKLIEENLLQ